MHYMTVKTVVLVQGCTRQAALERQDFSCMHLAHHELRSIIIIIARASTRAGSEGVFE